MTVTTCQDSHGGDKEFVVACKNRPFTILVSPNFPTPEVNFIDHKLVSELKLKMTDLQCRKLHFGSQKLRVLGKVSTSVQCITNGLVAGNLHFKASVVENLYEHFDSHGIAGHKLSQVFWQPTKPVQSKPKILPKVHKKRQMNGSPTSTNFLSADSHATDDDDDWAEATSAARSSTSSMGSPKCGFDFLPDVQRTAIASAIVQRRDIVRGETRCGTPTTPRRTPAPPLAPLRESPTPAPDQWTAIASAIAQQGGTTTPRGTTPAPLRGSPPGFPSSPRYRATPLYLNVEPDGQWTAVRRGWCDYCGTLCCVPSHLVSPFGPDDYYG